MNRTIETYDRIAPIYARQTIDRQPLTADYERFLSLLEDEHGQISHDYPLLDVGCGPGYDTGHFVASGWRTIGVDLSLNMILLGRQLKPILQTHEFAQANMGRLPFAAASVAGIWLCASLLHVPKNQVPAVLSELHRVLLPHGVMCLSVKEGDREEWTQQSYGEAEPRFFAYWQGEALDAVLQESGFDVIAGWFNESGVSSGRWVVRLVQKRLEPTG